MSTPARFGRGATSPSCAQTMNRRRTAPALILQSRTTWWCTALIATARFTAIASPRLHPRRHVRRRCPQRAASTLRDGPTRTATLATTTAKLTTLAVRSGPRLSLLHQKTRPRTSQSATSSVIELALACARATTPVCSLTHIKPPIHHPSLTTCTAQCSHVPAWCVNGFIVNKNYAGYGAAENCCNCAGGYKADTDPGDPAVDPDGPPDIPICLPCTSYATFEETSQCSAIGASRRESSWAINTLSLSLRCAHLTSRLYSPLPLLLLASLSSSLPAHRFHPQALLRTIVSLPRRRAA